MAGKCYNLAHAAKSVSECTTADAERLKRNMTYALHQYKTESFEIFKRMIWAVFYHHFGIHDTCGEWCRYLQNKDNPEELKKLYYRCKVKNANLYQQLLDIWNQFCTDESLREVHHEWHTNKCESMNQFITKFIRKCSHLCMTIVGRARTYLAVGIDSVGYEDYYRSLFQLLKIEYDEETMKTHHERVDARKIRKKAYDKLPEVRRRLAMGRAIRIRENIRKLLQDKKVGKSYESGMNGPAKKEKKSKSKNQGLPCKSCGKFGHVRQTHHDCTNSTYENREIKGEFRLWNVVVCRCF
jgi:hypothetical protein